VGRNRLVRGRATGCGLARLRVRRAGAGEADARRAGKHHAEIERTEETRRRVHVAAPAETQIRREAAEVDLAVEAQRIARARLIDAVADFVIGAVLGLADRGDLVSIRQEARGEAEGAGPGMPVAE